MIEKLQQILNENEGIILSDVVSRRYFLGFESSAGFILAGKNDAVFIVDARYFERAKKEIKNIRVSLLNDIDKQFQEFFESKVSKVFTTPSKVTVSEFKRFKKAVSPITISMSDRKEKAIARMRSVKSSEEIEKIKAAIKITDIAFTKILDYLKEGVTERFIRDTLVQIMKDEGGEGEAFSSIVVFGENTKNPHGIPSDKRLMRGEFVTLDFGAVKDGYCSDMTRTVAFGEPTPEMRALYDTVLQANERAEAEIKPGMTLISCDKIARDITERDYPGKFVHSLGHGIGVEVHEAPFISSRGVGKISEGMIFSVEPGIYLDNMGVRIEDLVLCTGNGVVNLCSSKKELIVIN